MEHWALQPKITCICGPYEKETVFFPQAFKLLLLIITFRIACFVVYSIIFVIGTVGNVLFSYIVISSRCESLTETNV